MKMIKKRLRTDTATGKRRAAGLLLLLLLSATAAVPVMAAEAAPEGGRGPAWEIMNRAGNAGTGDAGSTTGGENAAANNGGPSSGQEAPSGQNAEYNGDVNTLKAAKDAGSLILAVGTPGDPAKTVVSFYEKDESGILRQVFSVPAVSGLNGISADKREGDKKTPKGVYSFTMAFGIKEDPGSILPYHRVRSGDYFVDDPSSSYYNRLVNENEVERDWSSGENLIRQAPHYHYALVLNYNEDCVPGSGSAIFLHCPKAVNHTSTSGCISVPEEYAKELVRLVDKDTRIIVVAEESELADY